MEIKQFELTKEQKNELKEAFDVFDKDGDETISAEELQVVLEAVGRKMTREQVDDAIARIDKSGDGEIQFNEFLELMSEEMKEQMHDEELIEAFKFFGAKNDRDGITKKMLGDKLKELDEKITEDELDLLFEETCMNEKQEQITFEEFMLMMMAK